MPDAPDYYMYALSGKRHILNDMAELAARIGSIVNFDRTGQVVFASAFEHGTAPFYFTNVSGSESILVSSPVFIGDYAFAIKSAAPGIDSFGLFGKTFAPNEYNKWGLQLGVCFTAAFSKFKLSFLIDNGVNFFTAQITYNYATGIFTLYNNVGGETTFLTKVIIPPFSGYFHTFKLVIDTVTHQYIRLKIDDYEIGLSNYTYFSQATASNPAYSTEARFDVLSGQTTQCIIDHIVITTGEI